MTGTGREATPLNTLLNPSARRGGRERQVFRRLAHREHKIRRDDCLPKTQLLANT